MPASRTETILSVFLFALALSFHAWGMSVGWQSKNLPGVEYRQAQTALSAYFIKQEGDFSLAYPTPVLGKPWSVPMEFPLYQWTVVVVSRSTGLGLTKSGRAVSMACFYLTMPALFLLLGRWEVAAGRRWVVLALVVSCPFYVFYSRAFLIETMALMFSLWFWVAFEQTIRTRQLGWLALALLAGTAAGLVKVTTFLLYLLPLGASAVARLWRLRLAGAWRSDLRWMACALSLPLGASLWWIWYADLVKARNPMAGFLLSSNLRDFNLGTSATRVSPEIWAMWGRIVGGELTGLPVLLAGLVLVLACAGKRRAAALACVASFASALALFPVLYAYHDYYYTANAILLLLSIGLALVGLLEEPRYRLWGMAGAVLLTGAQAVRYLEHYYPIQREISLGGAALTDTLRALTRPEEILVVTGQDWNSMTPYYAQRRSLMLREEAEGDAGRIDTALRQLSGEKIGALVVTGQSWRNHLALVRHLVYLGLAPQPWLRSGDSWIFLPQNRWDELVRYRKRLADPLVQWAVVPQAAGALGGSWHGLTDITPEQQQLFRTMRPSPVRFFSSFEPVVQPLDQELSFGAHPWTRLVFWLPRGRHTLRGAVWFNPGAYQAPSGQEQTDGVGISLLENIPGVTEPKILQQLRLDPVRHPADREKVPMHFSFTLERDGEVELLIDPGPNGRDTRDWIWLRGPLVID